MARSPALSAATEQARLQQVIAAAGSGAKLWVYAGTQPAGPDTASHGQTLLAGPYVFGATLGTASATAPATLTINCSGVAPVVPVVTGAPAWWRLTASGGSDGSAGIADGSAATAGTFDLVIPAMIAGRPVGIKSWRILAHETRVSAVIAAREVVDVLTSSGNAVTPPASIGATNLRTGAFYAGNDGPANALASAIANDTITVLPGTYTCYYKLTPAASGITLRSSVVGTKVLLDWRSSPFQYMFDIPSGRSLVLEDLEIIGWKNDAESPVNNSVCLYTQGGTYTLTVRRCKISEFGCGTLIGYHPNGALVMESCEIDNCGNYNGKTHNIYAECGSVVLRGCWVHFSKSRADYVAETGQAWRVSWGHLVKVRSTTVLIEGCRLTMESGEGNRCIDSPNGGDITIRGNLIEFSSSQNAGGGQFISFGVEYVVNPIPLTVHKLLLQQNTFVNHAKDGNTYNLARYVSWIDTTTGSGIGAPLSTYSVIDNVFAGDYLPANKDGWYGTEGNVYTISGTANTVIASANMAAQMPNHATYDFTLTTPVAGSQNWAPYYYAHQAQFTARVDAGRGGVPQQNWGSGVDTGSYNGATYTWTPGRDANGVVNAGSWALVPLNTWVRVAGTNLSALDAVVKAAIPGWRDYGTNGGDWSGVTDAWVGMAWDTRAGNERGWIVCGGGHEASSNDGIYCLNVRKMAWSVQRLPTDPQYWTAEYKAFHGSFTVYSQAANYYYANQSNPEGVFYDEIYDPAHTDAQHSPRTPTSRHTYGSVVYVPTLGAAGKFLMGCRRYWEYDLATNTWATPKFPFGNQVGYDGNGGLGYTGENMQGWYESSENRYYVAATQAGAYSQPWSVVVGGTGWRWEVWPIGGTEGQQTAQELIGRNLWTLAYGQPPYNTSGRPTQMRLSSLDTKAIVTGYAISIGPSLSGVVWGNSWDGQAMTYVTDKAKWLCNIYVTSPSVIQKWAWLDPATWSVDLASDLTNAPSWSSAVETKLRYIPDIHAVIWVDSAASGIWVVKFA